MGDGAAKSVEVILVDAVDAELDMPDLALPSFHRVNLLADACGLSTSFLTYRLSVLDKRPAP